MLDITKDIQSLTSFRRRSGDFMKRLRKSKRPLVLTVKGRAAAVVQDAEGYQRLLDIAARADAVENRTGMVVTISQIPLEVLVDKKFFNEKVPMADDHRNIPTRCHYDHKCDPGDPLANTE